MRELVFATHNQHKAQEVAEMLRPSGIIVQSLNDIGIHDEIVEDGTTMTENAWIKANYIYNKFGCNVLSDDSGIEVDALNGAPGLYSARYAGPQKDSDDNINKLLREMKGIQNRSAQFRAVMALWINGTQKTFEGIVRGKIAMERIGTEGFGYDPIFIPEGYDTSFGVLSAEIKNTISHRARALEQVKGFLSSLK